MAEPTSVGFFPSEWEFHPHDKKVGLFALIKSEKSSLELEITLPCEYGDTEYSITILTEENMAISIEEAIEELEGAKTVRFRRLKYICEQFFGTPRIKGSHHIFRTGLSEMPVVNIQPDGSNAKGYQVKQVIRALTLLNG